MDASNGAYSPDPLHPHGGLKSCLPVYNASSFISCLSSVNKILREASDGRQCRESGTGDCSVAYLGPPATLLALPAGSANPHILQERLELVFLIVCLRDQQRTFVVGLCETGWKSKRCNQKIEKNIDSDKNSS